MSAPSPASEKGFRAGEPPTLPVVGFQSASPEPATIPTGQCATSNRGGDFAVWAEASRLRSMILSPTLPPTPARKARLLNRYDFIFAYLLLKPGSHGGLQIRRPQPEGGRGHDGVHQVAECLPGPLGVPLGHVERRAASSGRDLVRGRRH